MFRFPFHPVAPVTAGLIGALVTVQVFCAGCEPVRRKFIRKKRTANMETAVQPVFEPEDYPADRVPPADQYQDHYNRVLAWNQEVLTGIEEKASDKRIVFSLNACLKELEGMDGLLPESARGELRQIKGEMEKVRDEFSVPAAYRPYQNYARKLMRLDRRVRQTLKSAFEPAEGKP
ncbi:MAG TPA: hypothetical protein PLT76_04485 [Candidatus Omnitrophota bacterium]|nr:hypothetical protein [Candidatus Omnitrophota bacterium]HPB68533.1 hypothetical protein [Candidatus Omnitrophota bacterium]HQO57957.1 hypothetical protein [Candidatus Omnitrophota bacterium]